MTTSAFAPHYATGVSVTTGASATIIVPSGDRQVRIVNDGVSLAFIRTGLAVNGALTATAADFPVRGGESVVFTKGGDDRLAHFGTGTVIYIGTGNGGTR